MEMLWLLFLQNVHTTHFLHRLYLIHLVWNVLLRGTDRTKSNGFKAAQRFGRLDPHLSPTSSPSSLGQVRVLIETNSGFFKTGTMSWRYKGGGVFRREQLWVMGRISRVGFKAQGPPSTKAASVHQLYIGAHVRYEG